MEIDLTSIERRILINQYRILKKIDEDAGSNYDFAIEVLENGYELHYDIALGVLGEPLSIEACGEVLEIMSMYESMQRSYRALEDPGDISENDVRFLGFDGHTEADRMAYARFVVEEWGRFKNIDHRADFNSHMPLHRRYQRMLSAWGESINKYDLTRDDLNRILAAQNVG